MTSSAGKALRRWICAQGMQFQRAADLLGISSATVSSIISGRHRPSLLTALLIEAAAGIPAADWLTEDDKQRLGRLRV